MANKRNVVIAIILILCITITGCGNKKTKEEKNSREGKNSNEEKDTSDLINKVQVFIPNPTGPEAVVGLQANIAIQYYIEARMYLEKLSMQDASEVDPETFQKLVDDAVTAFENAEKISDSLSKSVDMWMVADDQRSQPEINVLQTADAGKSVSLSNPFVVAAHAAEKSPSELTAQEIVDAFDKAKNGQKIKTLAELLGTDAKHAYAELKIAQATLEGVEANKIAEQATTCIKVAKTLKTAGTVAGLVIAAAPVATGAVATMGAGEMLATGGGIIMGTVNSGLELTSTGATLYYGTDENKITMLSDQIADSKIMTGANLVVGLAGVGYNIKNQINDMSKLMDQAKNADEYQNLLTSLSNNLSTNGGKEASNLFGILSFGLGSIDVEKGTVLGISMDKVNDGMMLNVVDAKIGTSAEEQAAMKKVLQDTGYTIEESEKAVKQCAEMMESGKLPEVTPQNVSDLPAEFVENKLKENEAIAPGSTVVSLDEIIDNMETFMEVIKQKKAGNLSIKTFSSSSIYGCDGDCSIAVHMTDDSNTIVSGSVSLQFEKQLKEKVKHALETLNVDDKGDFSINTGSDGNRIIFAGHIDMKTMTGSGAYKFDLSGHVDTWTQQDYINAFREGGSEWKGTVGLEGDYTWLEEGEFTISYDPESDGKDVVTFRLNGNMTATASGTRVSSLYNVDYSGSPGLSVGVEPFGLSSAGEWSSVMRFTISR